MQYNTGMDITILLSLLNSAVIYSLIVFFWGYVSGKEKKAKRK